MSQNGDDAAGCCGAMIFLIPLLLCCGPWDTIVRWVANAVQFWTAWASNDLSSMWDISTTPSVFYVILVVLAYVAFSLTAVLCDPSSGNIVDVHAGVKPLKVHWLIRAYSAAGHLPGLCVSVMMAGLAAVNFNFSLIGFLMWCIVCWQWMWMESRREEIVSHRLSHGLQKLPFRPLAVMINQRGEKQIAEIVDFVNPRVVKVSECVESSYGNYCDTFDLSLMYSPGLEDGKELGDYQDLQEKRLVMGIEREVQNALNDAVAPHSHVVNSSTLPVRLKVGAESTAHKVRRERIRKLRECADTKLRAIIDGLNDPQCSFVSIDLSDIGLLPIDDEFRSQLEEQYNDVRRALEKLQNTMIADCIRRCATEVAILESQRARWAGYRAIPPVYQDLEDYVAAEISKKIEPILSLLDEFNEDAMLAHVKPILNDTTSPPIQPHLMDLVDNHFFTPPTK